MVIMHMSNLFNGIWLTQCHLQLHTSCLCRYFTGESLISVFVSWLTENFNKSVPLPLHHFVVDQLNEDLIWEPWGQVALDHNILALPLLGGLAFHKHRVGHILWSRACLGSVKVALAVHGQHGLLETHGKGGPVRGIFFEIWDGVGEYKERHSECDVPHCSNDSGSIGLGQGP